MLEPDDDDFVSEQNSFRETEINEKNVVGGLSNKCVFGLLQSA